jgi:hypothetical protein
MPRKTTDPIGCVPASAAVERALDEARRRVSTLEYLLEITRGVESRMHGEANARGPAAGPAAVGYER